ncbi:MAG: potassium transporter Kup [Magnetospirillum sp. WYHS-4]
MTMPSQEDSPESNAGRAVGLMFAAIGVVFGDIGTSPLYAIKETFGGPHPLPIDRLHMMGILSLVFWTIASIVTIKYVTVMMRADNRGEGGSLALLALVGKAVEKRPDLGPVVAALGIFAAALFYGDSMITPAISVLSAVEGLEVAKPELGRFIIPITIAILISLFAIQKHGTGTVGKLFGPVMTLWFLVLLVLGVRNIAAMPYVLTAISPHHAFMFVLAHPWTAFVALGSVVLAVTGAEALYTDMGHFGRLPIRLGWYILVLPALVLNYFGQGALLLKTPGAIENPFFLMAPQWALLPLVGLATAATVIASQAVISGAFSVTRQAIQLGYLPRMNIIHTSESEIGQVYIPFLNWVLMIAVAALVFGFGTSSNLAAAYGVAVTGTMLIDSVLIGMVMLLIWNWSPRKALPFIVLFAAVDLALFSANSLKIPYGGWFPLAVASVVFLLLTTWKKGRALLNRRLRRDALLLEDFLKTLSNNIPRVSGTAMFLTGTPEAVPPALLHNLKHNKVLHERVVFLTARIEEVPTVSEERRIVSEDLDNGFRRLVIRYGFMEEPNITRTLMHAHQAQLGFFFVPLATSYFLSREMLVPSPQPGMVMWRERLFAWMSRMAATPMDFFHLPHNCVVEMGTQVEI